MQGSGSERHHDDRRASLPTFVVVLLGSLVVSAVVTTAALVLVDRLDRPPLVLADATMPTIAVQIDGAVSTPGVYPLPAGARLSDLVRGAGGLTADADVADINLAARVGDGERVEIPTLLDGTPAAPPSGTEAPPVININTATVDELDRLPGIGPVLGERIVDYREQNGPFASLDEVANVEGISTRLLDELRPYITLND